MIFFREGAKTSFMPPLQPQKKENMFYLMKKTINLFSIKERIDYREQMGEVHLQYGI